MDEQKNPTPETPVITPDPVVADIPVVEPPQAEPAQAPAEPEAVAETPQIEPLSEPLPTAPETPTPQMGGNEALPESAPEPAPQGAEAPRAETLTAPPTPISDVSPSEETPLKAEESPRTPPETPPQSPQATPQPEPPQSQPQTQQGTPQPEPVRQQEPPALPPESVPAQAPVTPTPSRNILKLIFQKGLLTIKLRKQKKLIKVMGLFAKQKSITNDDVEKLLHVSDATALRYLTELKKANKITQVGKTGQGVTYTKR